MLDMLISAFCGALIYVLLEHWLLTRRHIGEIKNEVANEVESAIQKRWL